MKASGQSQTIPKRDLVYKTIKSQIYSGHLMPGTRLIELELAEQLGVSRTIIREVIHQLGMEGLVESIPYRGAAVARMSVSDLKEVYRIQQDLEGLAAYLASSRFSERQVRELERIQGMAREAVSGDLEEWQKWNTRFHRYFMAHCGNRRLLKLIEGHRDHFARYWYVLLSVSGQMEEYVQEHEGILTAVRRRKPLLVRHLMEKHVAKGAHRLLELIERAYPASFVR